VAAPDFDEFFETFFEPVARALMLAGAQREASRDAAQEAFVRALRRWRHVRELGRPDGWVYVVAMNCLRDDWRRKDRTSKRRGEVARTVTGVEPGTAVVTQLTVRDAIATLPVRQRQAVVLRYFADLPLADVADAMGCAVGTVQSTLHAARTSLRIELTDEEDADAS
jgi:RNA polymerase sigma-70 factor, ECF subfamily